MGESREVTREQPPKGEGDVGKGGGGKGCKVRTAEKQVTSSEYRWEQGNKLKQVFEGNREQGLPLGGPLGSGGVRHDPQRFMGKTVYAPHFNRYTVEFASRERDESKPGIKTLLPFLKNITEESDLENFQDLILALDVCYWLHKLISISLSRFGDERRCDFS